MGILVTHTLPPETYPDWVEFANIARLMMMHPGEFTPHLAQRILASWIDQIVPITPESLDFLEIFEQDFSPDVPVHPVVLLFATFNKTISCIEKPLTFEARANATYALVRLIAVSYNVSEDQVIDDLLAAHERTVVGFKSYKLARMAPGSEGVH